MTANAAPATDTLIHVESLTKTFGLRIALKGVTFSVGRGAVVALLGPNGSGKTTLLRTLSALIKQTSGKVTIGGWSLPNEASKVRAQLGVVSHLPLLYDDLSAEENLRFYARLYDQEDNGRIGEMLAKVGLTKRARDLTRTFSRGMLQRLALARAMLHDPAVMLLDEPYTGLDTAGSTLLDGLLHEWKSEGRTIILSLHDIERAARHCDRALILRSGKLVADTPLGDVTNLPELFESLTRQP